MRWLGCKIDQLKKEESMKKYLLFNLLLLYSVPANSAEMNANIVTDGEGVTYVNDYYFKNQEMHYKILDGMAITEGDIVLGPVKELKKKKKMSRSAIATNDSRWKNGEIPFVFSSSISSAQRGTIIKAMNRWASATHGFIVFVERTNEAHYVRITNTDKYGCQSIVGYARMAGQFMNLAYPGCGYGRTLHELGHTIGLWHEHNRADRDSYVQINWGNIYSQYYSAFKKYSYGRDVGTYDYYSIMHYPAYNSFGIDYDQPTIIPYYTAYETIGQLKDLSQGDINGVNYMYYPYSATLTSPSTKHRLPGKRVTFKWSYTGGNKVYLNLYGRNSSGSYMKLEPSSVSERSATFNNLAIDGSDIDVLLNTYTTTGKVTERYKFKAYLSKPNKPSSPTTTNIRDTTVTLRWKDTSNNEKGFKIYRNGKYIKSVPAGTTSFTDTGLKTGTTYTYTIKAYNDAGVSSSVSIKVATLDALDWYTPIDYNLVY